MWILIWVLSDQWADINIETWQVGLRMTRVGIVVHVSVAGIFIGYLKCIFNRYQNLNCVTLYAIFISGHRPKTWELLLLLLLFFILLLVFFDLCIINSHHGATLIFSLSHPSQFLLPITIYLPLFLSVYISKYSLQTQEPVLALLLFHVIDLAWMC